MMDPVTVGILGIICLVILIFSGVPVGVTLGLIGFGGFILILGPDIALSCMSLIPFETASRYSFAVIPLFLLMSIFVGRSGIGELAYNTARSWVGHIRGGLAMATVVACGLFAATSGSSLATAVAMGKVAYPEMKRLKYDSSLAIGCIAAGGSLGLLIPPSMAFILIGILTEVSIGRLFIAGIIPGILEIVAYGLTIWIVCKRKPEYGPAVRKASFRQKPGWWRCYSLVLSAASTEVCLPPQRRAESGPSGPCLSAWSQDAFHWLTCSAV